jgi:hypothetical protein
VPLPRHRPRVPAARSDPARARLQAGHEEGTDARRPDRAPDSARRLPAGHPGEPGAAEGPRRARASEAHQLRLARDVPSLILAVRPDLEKFVELMTHPAPKRAAQLYDRLSLYWPGMCEAVLAIRLDDASAKARPQRARAIKHAVQNAVHFAVQSQSTPDRGQEKGPGVPGPWVLQDWRALEDLNREFHVRFPALPRVPVVTDASSRARRTRRNTSRWMPTGMTFRNRGLSRR